MHKLVSAAAATLLLVATPALAGGDTDAGARVEDKVLSDLYASDDPRGNSRNRVEIFGGGTNFVSDWGGTGGASYEYRLNATFGIAATVLGSAGDFEAFTVAIPIYYYSVDMIRLMAGPAWVSNEDQSVAVLQVGILWDFFFSRYTVSPTAVFYVRDENLATTVGLTIGRIF